MLLMTNNILNTDNGKTHCGPGSTGRNLTWACTAILFTLKHVQTCIRTATSLCNRLLTISCCGLWRMCNYNFVLFCVFSLLRSADSVHFAAECGPGGGSRSKFLPDVFLRYPAAHFLSGHWHITHCWWAHTTDAVQLFKSAVVQMIFIL